jgi:hypothetical protein
MSRIPESLGKKLPPFLYLSFPPILFQEELSSLKFLYSE